MQPVYKKWFNRIRAAVLLVTELDKRRHLKKMEIILAMNMEKGYTHRGTQQR